MGWALGFTRKACGQLKVDNVYKPSMRLLRQALEISFSSRRVPIESLISKAIYSQVSWARQHVANQTVNNTTLDLDGRSDCID